MIKLIKDKDNELVEKLFSGVIGDVGVDETPQNNVDDKKIKNWF